MSKTWGEIREEALRRCGQLPPKTNADHIRGMTDEEIAELLGKSDAVCPPLECPIPNDVCNPKVCWLKWLKSPVEVDDVRSN